MPQSDIDDALSSLNGSGVADMCEKLKSGLSAEKREMLDRALTDENYLKSILSSDKAERIINELKKKGKL